MYSHIRLRRFSQAQTQTSPGNPWQVHAPDHCPELVASRSAEVPAAAAWLWPKIVRLVADWKLEPRNSTSQQWFCWCFLWDSLGVFCFLFQSFVSRMCQNLGQTVVAVLPWELDGSKLQIRQVLQAAGGVQFKTLQFRWALGLFHFCGILRG